MGSWLLGLGACAASPTLIDGDERSGYAIYRTGRLGARQLEQLCRLGVEELIVMDGTARQRECRMRTETCAQLRIRYDQHQDPRVPSSRAFLTAFDRWVEESRREGRKIAFRCRQGWHRAGRLAAYYRMGHQEWEKTEAIDEMQQVGKLMWRYPELQPQVEAMVELLETGACTKGAVFCPQVAADTEDRNVYQGNGRFASDVCDAGPDRGNR